MSTAFLHGILRLPVCLREQAIRNASRGHTSNHGYQALRLKSSTTSKPPRQRQGTRAIPSSTSRPPVSSRPPKPTAVPSSKPTLSVANPPPKLPKPAIKPGSNYAETLLHTTDEILLYRAPAHRSYYITSYILGGALFAGAYNWATLVTSLPGADENKSWTRHMVSVANTLSTVLVTIFSSVLIMAPWRLVRSISLLAKKGADGVKRPILQFSMRRSLPFMKPKVIQILPSQTFLDRKVSAMDINFSSVALREASAFIATADQDAPIVDRKSNPVARGWNTFKRDIRRMCYREGIAYLRLKDQGNWKLDLQNCALLEEGKPLDRLTGFDEVSRGREFIAWVARLLQA
ncbi:hypothetical protein LTR86_007852 [Recurvomyces mirabilis]|nr:hypothetical protein LTR86_007852 [Recurvomyces mirabilis]